MSLRYFASRPCNEVSANVYFHIKLRPNIFWTFWSTFLPCFVVSSFYFHVKLKFHSKQSTIIISLILYVIVFRSLSWYSLRLTWVKQHMETWALSIKISPANDSVRRSLVSVSAYLNNKNLFPSARSLTLFWFLCLHTTLRLRCNVNFN